MTDKDSIATRGMRTPFGSPLLAAGDGSDTGGSLRTPGSFCNLVGYRPSLGRIPLGPGRNPWTWMSRQGFLARRTGDIRLLMQQVAGTPTPHYLDWMRAATLISATGLPSLSVPGGFSSGGLPVGLQMVTADQADGLLLDVAETFEEATLFADVRPELGAAAAVVAGESRGGARPDAQPAMVG